VNTPESIDDRRHAGAEAAYRVSGRAVVNVWQRGVPVYGKRLLTIPVLLLMAVAIVGLVVASIRMVGGLGAYTGLNDAYPWGIWKTFNVMVLTALGSGGMSVGIAAWVLYRKRLHTLMRTAVVTSLIFYSTALLALVADVGRPWNMWHILLPWHWNTSSPLWEVMLAMPIYTVIFLVFENLPIWLERIWYTSPVREHRWVDVLMPKIRKVYPFVIAGAYVLPMMHQSSLGALMLLSGHKLQVLWQTPALPGFYLVQAGICGMAFVIVTVMGSSLIWRRPLDMRVLGEAARLMAWVILFWVVARFADIAIRGELAAAFSLDGWSRLFLLENLLILTPGVILLSKRLNVIPRVVFQMSVLTVLGAVAYRFIPTTIAYDPGANFAYFPTTPEILITSGLVCFSIALFITAVKLFAILPGPLATWNAMFDYLTKRYPNFPRDAHGHPTHHN
jgi:Ni/Fe-hydrogenase subunit HybB-like protein